MLHATNVLHIYSRTSINWTRALIDYQKDNQKGEINIFLNILVYYLLFFSVVMTCLSIYIITNCCSLALFIIFFNLLYIYEILIHSEIAIDFLSHP